MLQEDDGDEDFEPPPVDEEEEDEEAGVRRRNIQARELNDLVQDAYKQVRPWPSNSKSLAVVFLNSQCGYSSVRRDPMMMLFLRKRREAFLEIALALIRTLVHNANFDHLHDTARFFTLSHHNQAEGREQWTTSLLLNDQIDVVFAHKSVSWVPGHASTLPFSAAARYLGGRAHGLL